MAIDSRPPIDIVVPFVGSDHALHQLIARLDRLRLEPQDTLTVVDNRPSANAAWRQGRIAVLPAPREQSSYHARNVGAAAGANPWILFLDADVVPPTDLAEHYFDEPLDDRVGVVAGAIRDAPARVSDGIAARYAYLEQTLSHENVLAGTHPFAQTANALVRRAAFAAVGGFTEGIRSGGDADLSLRIVQASWTLASRPATVEHLGRPSVRRLLRQYVRYGAGAAWLEARHPGFLRVRPWSNLLVGVVRGLARAAVEWPRGERDAAIVSGLRPMTRLSFRLGSYLSNAAGPRLRLRLRTPGRPS